MRPPATKGNKKKDKLGDKKEDKLGDKLGDKGDKTSGRRTHHPTQAHMWGDNGRQGVTRPRKGDTPSNTGTRVGRQWETMARNRRQGEMGRQKGRQWETIGIQLGGQRGKWRKDLGEVDKPSNTGAHVRRQGETKRREGGHTIQHRQTRGDKTAGRRTHHPRQRHHPTQAHMWGENGRQGETRPWEGGSTIQHRHIGRQWETMKNKTSGRRTIQHRHTCGETMGDNWRQWETIGDNWRQG